MTSPGSSPAASAATRALGTLGIDLGLKTGLALVDAQGHPVWARSHNFGSVSRMKSGVLTLLREAGPVSGVVMEGDRHYGDIWERAATKLGFRCRRVAAETWRAHYPRLKGHPNTAYAKKWADEAARELWRQSPHAPPKALRHDAAEALLIARWGYDSSRS